MNSPAPAPRPQFFRSLNDLQGAAEFNDILEREFPTAASEFPEGISRRRWMQLMGASVAFAGAAGCRYNKEEFAAFVVEPEGRIPGLPEAFATNFEWAGRVVNALVSSVDGRPIKVDGNSSHPVYTSPLSSRPAGSSGKNFAHAGTDVYTQASVLSLYDPDRIGAVVQRTNRTQPPTPMVTVANSEEKIVWSEFDRLMRESRDELVGDQGASLAILYEPCSSPTFNRMLAEVAAKYPQATLVRYESVDRDNAAKGIDAAGGGRAKLHYRLDRAAVILAVDADLFGNDRDAALNMWQYTQRRNPNDGEMNRLYSVESQYSVTGSTADFRYPLQSTQMVAFLQRLEAAIDAAAVPADAAPPAMPAYEPGSYSALTPADRLERVIETLAWDLLSHRGRSAVTVGFHQVPEAHRIALRINAKLGNIGTTVQLLDVADELADVASVDLGEFVRTAGERRYNTAWVFAWNPVYTASGDIDLSRVLLSIPNVFYAAEYDDETAAVSTWSLPTSHPLESWSDVRSVDGSYGVCQPMIASVTGSRMKNELLAILAGLDVFDPLQLVRQTAEGIVGGGFNDRVWQEILHDGFLRDSAAQPTSAQISTEADEDAATPPAILVSDQYSVDLPALEVIVFPSETTYDGRVANNGWLQECPHPITKLTWDNAALMSPATAKKLGVQQGQGRDSRESELVVIRHNGATAKLPVFIVLGMAEGTIAVQLGYGRTRAGSVGGLAGQFLVGHSIQGLRKWNQGFILTGAEVIGTSVPYKLATTQEHFAISDRLGMDEIPKRAATIVREGTMAEFEENRKFAEISHHGLQIDSLWKEPDVAVEHAWGMAIDLNKCTGCSACVIACQAENNVPIVGKEQVSRGREMHWLRIDRYYTADMKHAGPPADSLNPRDPRMVTQPMMCVHCETAPCEQVCPVAATVHTEEGINHMAYNRCVGTRYCANNCPYKVRRFNYFNYNQKYGYFYGWQDHREEVNTKLQSLVLNPEVTVRGRGVMEKCTYCVQRVQNGKIMARNISGGNDVIEDGFIRTACQEACPTQAIIFGDLLDKESLVYALHTDPRSYAVLDELNTKPRTEYLARLRNVLPPLMTWEQAHPDRGHGAHHDEHEEGHGDHAEAVHAEEPTGRTTENDYQIENETPATEL